MNNRGNPMKKKRWCCPVEENALFFMWNLVTFESKNKITRLLVFPDTSLFPLFTCLSSHLSIVTTSLIQSNSFHSFISVRGTTVSKIPRAMERDRDWDRGWCQGYINLPAAWRMNGTRESRSDSILLQSHRWQADGLNWGLGGRIGDRFWIE